MAARYIHIVYELDRNRNILGVYDEIITKKLFRSTIIDLYFKQGFRKKLAFRLKDSPNKTLYGIIPYFTRYGNPGLLYYDVVFINGKKTEE
jgi:hypothetical protein